MALTPCSTSSTSRASVAVVPIHISTTPVAAGNDAVPVSAVAVEKHSPSAAAPKPASTKTTATPASSTGIAFHLGITYSPYLGGGGCKSASQVAADVAKLGAYNVIRLYDIDCNGLANVLAAAPASTRVFAGISRISNVHADLASLAAQVGGHWARIHTVAIGNELVNSGAAAAPAVVAAIGQARPQLRAAGFAGPVVTVDTAVATVHNPALGQASDYCAVNAHAFFDPGSLPQNAGSFVQGWVRQVQAAVPGKAVVVTESGWPSAGSANGKAVPSVANQQAAIASLKAAFEKGGLVLFTAFNDLWKKNTALTFGAEQYWGILGNSPSG